MDAAIPNESARPVPPPPAAILKRRLTTREVVAGCVCAVLAIIGMAAFEATAGRKLGLRAGPLLVWLLALYPLSVLAVVVHELGHLAGGRLGGMRFLMFVVPPIRITRTAAGVRITRARNFGSIGGLAASTPDPSRPLLPQMVPLILGGPLASLLLALASGALAVTTTGTPQLLLATLAVVALLGFVFSAVPLKIGGMWTDGRQLLDLARGGALVERRWVVMSLMMALLAGTRPRDLDARQLERALGYAPGELLFDVSTWYYAYAAASDAGRVADAGRWLDRIEEAFERYPQGLRQGYALELAYFEAAHRGNTVRAKAWLAHASGGLTEPCRVALAQAALAAAEGRDGDATSAIARCRDALREPIVAGTAPMTADQAAALEAKLAAAPA